jgi:3-oxoacyl-[acyl-carrier protein] reductase
MNIDLRGKRVIVTGASRGIGAAIAKGFAREGARLAVCARNAEAIGAAAREAQLLGAQIVVSSVIDVRDTAEVHAWIEDIAKDWGGVDILVNNAGQGKGGNIDTLKPEEILEHANALQVAHFRCAQAVVPHMRRQRWGRIININALAGVIPTPDGIPSVSNRAASIAMSRSLGMALAKDNILVNSLNMGWIDTGQWDRHYREMSPTISRQEFLTMATKVVPLGRFGKPEDVVGMVLFLCSEFASFITAASIDISGGLQGQIAYYPTLKRELQELGIAREKAADESRGGVGGG